MNSPLILWARLTRYYWMHTSKARAASKQASIGGIRSEKCAEHYVEIEIEKKGERKIYYFIDEFSLLFLLSNHIILRFGADNSSTKWLCCAAAVSSSSSLLIHMLYCFYRSYFMPTKKKKHFLDFHPCHTYLIWCESFSLASVRARLFFLCHGDINWIRHHFTSSSSVVAKKKFICEF